MLEITPRNSFYVLGQQGYLLHNLSYFLQNAVSFMILSFSPQIIIMFVLKLLKYPLW